MNRPDEEQRLRDDSPREPCRPVPWIRSAIGGLLMGLANLVPGVSGGTMILIVGLYEEFISATADLTRLRFSRRSLSLLGVIAGMAGLTIVTLAKVLASLVTLHPVAMYSLFIGMTLGGVPMLWRMLAPARSGSFLMLIAGILLMVMIAATQPPSTRRSDEEKAKIRAMVQRGEFPLHPNYTLDLTAGMLGMSAMVLPGISGAYMLLILGRYEQILGAIGPAKEYILSAGQRGDLTAMHILLPVAVGMIISLIGVTNILKWLMHRHKKITLAFLLGVLLGSVVTLFPMLEFQSRGDWMRAGVLLPVGFVLTLLLERIEASTRPDLDFDDETSR